MAGLFNVKKKEPSNHLYPPGFIKEGQFSPEQLEVAQLIQRRRLQMLVHSRIYYELDQNLISDHKWQDWAQELADLQEKYPDISKKLCFADDFVDWDGSTGAFLPLHHPWVVRKADQVLNSHGRRGNRIEYKEVQQGARVQSSEEHRGKATSKQRSNRIPQGRRLF